ncbi:hypothetical protein L0F51_09610 [Afifella sp. H1R]|uniref:hypothetical protein n=1 Tax=Afifella sp. H1R TaxID=2908841 RepID=UPI001F412061|nr:hypothetical protein [Afifella sp. H1R]
MAPQIDNESFRAGFVRFQELIESRSGHPFHGFHEGLAAVWENYKPRLRDHARGKLELETWEESDIGSGTIVSRTIEAIEIQDSHLNLTNNLVFWQNRFGHANREHRVLLEAQQDAGLRQKVERLLFGLYRRNEDEGTIFEALNHLFRGRYPLLAYLFFLKDDDRFMPIQPTGFDRAFATLNIDFTTLRHCSWENYTTFNSVLNTLRPMIAKAADIKNVRLIDAHSFCWIFSTLLKEEMETGGASTSPRKHEGRVVGGVEKAVLTMRINVESTVRNANGQKVLRTLKNKELRMSANELEAHIRVLLARQQNRCALTGIRLNLHEPDGDKNFLPSLDRIDSNGHYELGNLQVVCQFVNFWKGDSDDEEFRQLLACVRSGHVGVPT